MKSVVTLGATLLAALRWSTGIKTGIAAGDVLTNIEVVQATGFADILVGDGNANIFIGGEA